MTQQDKKNSEWPYGSLLLMGFFGTDSPEGKKLAIRSLLTVLLFIAGFIGAQIFESSTLTSVGASLMPLSILLIFYSYVVYHKSLDTLERLIQLTAFAASYGTVLFIAVTIYALNLVSCFSLPLVLFLLAEPVRGMCLYFISKSYA